MTLHEIALIKNVALPKGASLKEVLSLMRMNGIGSVVLLEDRKPVGIVTERDILGKYVNGASLMHPAITFATRTIIATHANRTLEYGLSTMLERNVRRIILLTSEGEFSGLVLQEQMLKYLEEDVYKVHLYLEDILKNRQLFTADKETPISEVLEQMRIERIGSVLITNERGQSQGIVTERDILKCIYEGEFLAPVRTIMSVPVVSMPKRATLLDAIREMEQCQIRRIVVTDEHKNALGIVTNRDVMKRIRHNYGEVIETKLKHAKEILDYLPEAIIEVYGQDGVYPIQWMNKKAKERFGLHCLDQSASMLMGTSAWKSLLSELDTKHQVENYKVTIEDHRYEVSGSESINAKNRFIKLIFKDIDVYERMERKLREELHYQVKKRLENEYLLLQQSKLATMGEMIGNIAHQWRQPLAQIGGIFMNLEASYEFNQLRPEEMYGKLRHGNELIKYMSTTIDDFRNFFRPNREKKHFTLETHLRSAIDLLSAALTFHRIKLTLEVESDSLEAYGYPNEFAQTILNIMINAKDVLVERKIPNPEIIIRLRSDTERALISVEDNGGGVEEGVMGRIFEPYFTTKQDEGTGLGLHMARIIVESNMQGSIDVRNTHKGACFTIRLPLSTAGL